MSNKRNILPREAAEQNTAPTSMSLYKPSTVYDKKSFELSVTTRCNSLPFSDMSMLKLPAGDSGSNGQLGFTIPFNSVFRRLLDNDLFNERLLCVVNGGDAYYGANLINNLCSVLSSSTDTYICSPQVKSQEISVVRQTEATIEEAMKNKLGYNYAYHQRLIANGTTKTLGDTVSDKMYDEYLNYLKSRLSASVPQADNFIRYVPVNSHCAVYHNNKYYFGTDHGLFMCDNPFLDNALCAQASVIWPYGYDDGRAFIDDDDSDTLHAGSFNHSAVQSTTGKTMRGTDVYANVRANPTANLDNALPQFDVFAVLPVSFDASSAGALSCIEAVVGTSHGLWALITNLSDSYNHKVDELEGWEEDQVSAATVTYEWIPINEHCISPDNEYIYLKDLQVKSIVRSEDNPALFYLGTEHGLFSCVFNGVYETEDETTGRRSYAASVTFKNTYGFYDAVVSSMVYVHPDGYDDSVLAGTDYGVLQATNSWFPAIDKTHSAWPDSLSLSSSIVTGIGIDTMNSPRIIALSSETEAYSGIYKLANDQLIKIYSGVVCGLYKDILDNAWAAIAHKDDQIEVLSIPIVSDPPELDASNVLMTISNSNGIKKCLAYNDSIYFVALGMKGRQTEHERTVYKLTRRRITDENILDLTPLKVDDCVYSFAVAQNNNNVALNEAPDDILFVATAKSIYAFMPGAKITGNFLATVNSIPNGSDVHIVGHASCSEYSADIMFYQNQSGTYASTINDFKDISRWTRVNNISHSTAIDDSITSLFIENYGRIVVTRGGVFNMGFTEYDELWFGRDPSNPAPVIDGAFVGAALLDYPDVYEQKPNIKMLLLTALNGSLKELRLYSIDTDDSDPKFIYEESIAGLNGDTPRIILNPFNSGSLLSAIVVKDNKLHSVSTQNSNSSSRFDPESITPAFNDVVLNLD